MSTCEIILLPAAPAHLRTTTPPPDAEAAHPSRAPSDHQIEDVLVVSAAQKWNDPPNNKLRLLSCYFAFLVYGINDSAPGAMLPLLEVHYRLPRPIVSLIFLGPMVGSVIASLTSNRLHARWGRRGVAALSLGCYAAAYLGLCLHPPFPVVVSLLVLTGFGSGLMNGSWNSWVGSLVQGSALLGFMHGFWGVGATLAPIISSALVKSGHGWWTFYYIMLGMAALAATLAVGSFWNDSGSRGSSGRGAHFDRNGFILQALRDRTTLMLSAFMVLYVGSEATIGGWLITFMMNVRKGTPSASSLVASGFWIGITTGRFALGWLTGYVGEKPMVAIYLLIAIALELAFWLGKRFLVSAIMAAFVGLSIGMIMPSGIRLMTKLLPPERHIVSVGFATAFASSGSAIFPFIVGALTQAYGVEVLQPFILALLGMQLVLWLSVSSRKYKA